MQVDLKKDPFPPANRGTTFQSATLSKGYFVKPKQQDLQLSINPSDHNISDHPDQLDHPSTQAPIQSSSRRTIRQSHKSTPIKEQTPTASQQTIDNEITLTKNSRTAHHRRTYKKNTYKKNMQELEDQFVETLDDDVIKKQDQALLSKEHYQVLLSKESEGRKNRGERRTGKAERLQKAAEEVFELDDLEAHQEPVEDQGTSHKLQETQQKCQAKSQSKLENKKRRTKGQIVFQQEQSDPQQQYDNDHKQEGQSPQRLHEPKKQQRHPITPTEQSLSKQPTTQNNVEQSSQSPRKQITKQHLLKILTYSVKEKMIMRTNLWRVNSFLFNTYPEYHLYFQADRTYLMSAKRVSKVPYSTFVISMKKGEFEENGEEYLGKAKGSVLGDQLNLYGKGLSPANAMVKGVKPRQLLATVVYETRVVAAGQPRNFKVYLKNLDADYYEAFPEIKLYGQEIPLNLLYQNPHNRDKITVLKNQKPQYSLQVKGYSLNFKGRALMASVKNFLLQNDTQSSGDTKSQTTTQKPSTAQNPISSSQQQPQLDIMMFGKAKDNMFNMDLSAPLSPFIAFGIALSSFDEKYFCQ